MTTDSGFQNLRAAITAQNYALVDEAIRGLEEQYEGVCRELALEKRQAETEEMHMRGLREQHEALKRDYLDMAAKWDGAREESAEHERSAARLEREKAGLKEQLEAQQEHIRRAAACLDDALALSNPAISLSLDGDEPCPDCGAPRKQGCGCWLNRPDHPWAAPSPASRQEDDA